MVHVVNPRLIEEIGRYGAFDIQACFNCGNCTAVCQLSTDDNRFPRRLIRYGQIGARERLLGDGDLWLCYHCGDCTTTCPRQADPAQFMASARRYGVAHYDPTGLAKLYYRSAATRTLLLVTLSALFALLLLWHRGDMNGRQLALFDFIPGPLIHDLGVGIFAIVGLAGAAGAAWMAYRIVRRAEPAAGVASLPGLISAAAATAWKEVFAQLRYHQCGGETEKQSWLVRPWLVHAAIFWGFLLMLAATTLDFLLKPMGSYVSFWSPIRLLGTGGGLLCLYGLAVVLYRRFAKKDDPYKSSRFDDWFFPLLLAAVVATGLLTEAAVYLPPSPLSYLLFLVHVVLAMDLLVLLPITKFAHAIYRPLALALAQWAVVRRSKRNAAE